jgi:hypothetical protein
VSEPVRVRTLSGKEVCVYLLVENIKVAEKLFEGIKLPPRGAGLSNIRGAVLALQFLRRYPPILNPARESPAFISRTY